ncbi:hypothetical protein RRG08_022608 [Elysia crispata]|uniref:Aquaporin n=1 Tax=Elysia crispata TaxID=231223 RepID=A0AAE0Z1R2_9GAST|nr:hypothetical protein RRG08_022608 [Elysia crispata]
MDRYSSKLSLRKYPLLRECFAEFLGTFLLVTFGDGSVAQAVLSRGANGDQNTVAWSFGVGITTGVLVSGSVSGGHINPAVSLAMVCLGRLPLKKFPFYALAQYLGGLVASLFIYLVYTDALDNFDDGDRKVGGPSGTAGIWATYPQPYVSIGNGFGDQIFGTALLVICVLAITDKFNSRPSSGLAPFLVGYVVVGIAMAFGLNAAFAINPARDLAPRIFTACAGWGSKPFSFRSHEWFWVPVVAPHLGALTGAAVYELCVGIHWPERYREDQLASADDNSSSTSPGYQHQQATKMDAMGRGTSNGNDCEVRL